MFRMPYRLQTTGPSDITPTVTSIGMCHREIRYVTSPITYDRTAMRETDQSRSQTKSGNLCEDRKKLVQT